MSNRHVPIKYKPNHGGHAPSFLRDKFQHLVEYIDEVDSKNKTIKYEGRDISILWLIGQLWNCKDVIPSIYCSDLDLPSGASYAQGARALKSRFK